MTSRLFILVASIVVTALLAIYAFYERRAGRNPADPNQSRMKAAWIYWLWRLYVPLSYSAFAYFLILALRNRDIDLLVFVTIVLGPLFLFTVAGWATFATFGFDYSVFGKYRRTPLPMRKPLYEVWLSYAIIGKVRTGPLVTWQFHAHGIGIRIATIGDVFIPLQEIDTLELRQGFMVLTSELTHHCPEVRSPIAVPNGVAKIMAHYYPAKVLVAAKRI